MYYVTWWFNHVVWYFRVGIKGGIGNEEMQKWGNGAWNKSPSSHQGILMHSVPPKARYIPRFSSPIIILFLSIIFMAELTVDRDSAADLDRPHPARCVVALGPCHVHACLLGMLSRVQKHMVKSWQWHPVSWIMFINNDKVCVSCILRANTYLWFFSGGNTVSESHVALSPDPKNGLLHMNCTCQFVPII